MESCDGYLEVTSTIFTVNDATITITGIANHDEYSSCDNGTCFEYKDVIEVSLIADCFSPGTYLDVLSCDSYSGYCTSVGSINVEDTCILIQVKEGFEIGKQYYIKVQSVDGYVYAVTGTFLISSSCSCKPSISITSVLEDCYKYKDT